VNRRHHYDAQRSRCGALQEARSGDAQASLTNALLGDTGSIALLLVSAMLRP